MRREKLWHGLMTTIACLLVLCICATFIANTYAVDINMRFGTSNYVVAVDEADIDVDSTYFKSEFSTLGELVEKKDALSVQIAAEGCVLLKNDNQALPLDIAAETITLWGLNSHNPTMGGMIGSSIAVDSEHGQLIYNVEMAFQERGFQLNQEMISLYSSDEASEFRRKNGHSLTPNFGKAYENPKAYKVGEMPARLYTDQALASADGTTAIVVLSRDNSEASDYSTVMKSGTEGDSFERPLALSDYEISMIELAKEHSEKVIVLINAVNPIEIETLKQDDGINAILWTGLPGANGFLGVADILSGVENPSGHLQDTYAVNSASSPAMVNFGLYLYTNNSQVSSELAEDDKGDWYVVESEGIYSGYKYYETRYEDEVLGQGKATADAGSSNGTGWSYENEVTYPFGFGLSYTTFEQVLKSVNMEVGAEGSAEVEVTNTGDVAGKSVIQLYVQAPYTEGGLEKASIQLIGFAKTKVLEPGTSETVTVTFDPQYIASYDETIVKEDDTLGAYVLEAGDYYFSIGNGAHEALNNILAVKQGSQDDLFVNAGESVKPENAILWTLAETDVETYSVNVKNAFEDCDINKMIADTVEYTTRSDWTKGWTPVEAITPTEAMMVALKNQTYQFSENGEGLVWGAQNNLQLIDLMLLDEDGQYTGVLPLNDPQWDALIDEITLDEAISFLGSGGQYIASINLPKTQRHDGPIGFVRDQVKGYYVRWTESEINEPTYVAETDEKATYSMPTFPTEPVIASTFNQELAEREGELMGEDALWANENGILAPALNIHRNPYCARNHEYYSEDAMLTNILGVALCGGAKSKGLMMQAKHLAFNHQELNRSGISTFFNEQAVRENELRAFQGVCETNTAMGIMTAFNRAGTQFSGGHEGLQIQVLRNEWGFTGWITTDMINGPDYMNWKDVVFSGGGNVLTDTAFDSSKIGNMSDHKAEIEKDTFFQTRMKDALKYWAYTCLASNTMNGFAKNSSMVYVRTWWQNAILAVDVVLAVLTITAAVMYILSLRKKEVR